MSILDETKLIRTFKAVNWFTTKIFSGFWISSLQNKKKLDTHLNQS